MAYRDVILSKTVDYVRTTKLAAAGRGAIVMIDCPFCHFPKSAQIIPTLAHIKCVHCSQMFNLIDLIRHVENKKDETEESILNYVRDLLKIDVQTTTDADKLDKIFKTYTDRGWAIVPCSKKGKKPIQAEWQKKENRNPTEWFHWISSGLNIGVRTGSVSNLTVIDFDFLTRQEKAELVKPHLTIARKAEILNKKVIPAELKAIIGETLMQETHGGIHLFYKFTELPKTAINYNDIHIDLENEGGQVIIPPAPQVEVEEEYEEEGTKKKRVVGYGSRMFINDLPIAPMPQALVEWLQARIGNKTPIEESGKLDEVKPFVVPDNFKVKDLNSNRNNTLTSLGGIFRQEMNIKQTGFALNVLNKHLLNDPLPQEEIQHILQGLNTYIGSDDNALSKEIVAYLKDTDTASKQEIESACFGGRTTSENKKRLDRTLMFLLKEEKIAKKNQRDYKILKDMEWTDTICNIGKKVDFKVPYFHQYANFNYGDVILIGGTTKVGKCFTKDTPILMVDGTTKKVQEINKGDKVQGINNTTRLVKDIAGGYGATYKIEPWNNESFTVNGEHILCLVHTETDEKITISVNDYLKKNKWFKHCYKLYRDTVNWKSKKTTIDPYFMGLWLGDGDSASSTITTMDEPIVNYLKGYAEELQTPFITHVTKDRCPRYSITNRHVARQHKNGLTQRLRAYNVINNKYIPNDFKINSKTNRLKLLAGLIDSDGYLNKKGNYELSFVNETLANDTAFVARSLGFSAKVSKQKAMFNTIRYRFHIVGDTTMIPTKLKRKQSKKTTTIKDVLKSGFKITPVGKQKYYGFTLDGDHLFLLGNFIVNHNTTVSMNIVKRLVDQGIKPYYIYNENGSRFAQSALRLGLKDKDFNLTRCTNPTEIVVKPNSVYIYDWFRPNDFTKTAELFDGMADKLDRAQSFMICFAQLRDGNEKMGTKNEWFAKDQIRQFVALSAKYLYDDKEGINTYFEVADVRDSKTGQKFFKIPCKYIRESMDVKPYAEIEAENRKEV